MLTPFFTFLTISILSCLVMNAQDIRTAFIKKYSNVTSLSVKFTVDNQFETLSMKAKKGNKFVLEQKSVMIYCDGSTVWNVNKETNKCMISHRDIHNESTSIDDIFLGVLNTYIVEKTMTVNETKSGSGYYIVMKPKSKDEIVNGIENLIIILDKKTLRIKTIQFKDNSNSHTITIKSLKLNEKLNNSLFSFTPSKAMTIVDLR
jgi:outer membrane lipoprotein-sorting protein